MEHPFSHSVVIHSLQRAERFEWKPNISAGVGSTVWQELKTIPDYHVFLAECPSLEPRKKWTECFLHGMSCWMPFQAPTSLLWNQHWQDHQTLVRTKKGLWEMGTLEEVTLCQMIRGHSEAETQKRTSCCSGGTQLTGQDRQRGQKQVKQPWNYVSHK